MSFHVNTIKYGKLITNTSSPSLIDNESLIIRFIYQIYPDFSSFYLIIID